MDDTTLIISCDGSDDSSSYVSAQDEPEETTQSTFPVTDDRTQLGFYSDELRVLRWMFRFLSLWCPASAGWIERCAYPFLVNLLLLQVILSDFYVLATQNWKSLEVYVFLAIDLDLLRAIAAACSNLPAVDWKNRGSDLQSFGELLTKKLDYLVEDIYCYSEFHAPCGEVIRQLPKISDTKDDIQNLKIQNNAYWRDMQKCDSLS
ncbi:uncharacterized protein [Montipora foliosa]|uniref:uncharacterized protein isoform X3 n=1 Tax=Montipora foliosa TaxID=591990 RepID=UPI0035F16D39